MSHDRGCFCGREKWDYDSCPEIDCWKKRPWPNEQQKNNSFENLASLSLSESKDELSLEEQINELSEMVNAYRDQYIYYKDLIFDLIEGKITLDELKLIYQLNYEERGGLK